VLDDRPDGDGRLATIGKAYSGLTDAELAEMTIWFKEHTLRQLGRYYVVEPTMVLEVAFDVIQRSNRHDSGFALRFPRIVRLRPDKQPSEIDTLSTVEKLADALAEGGQYRVAVRAPA
jgi:DNA ligase-1